MPRLSVIMAARQAGTFLEQAAKSILAQLHAVDGELVVVDNTADAACAAALDGAPPQRLRILTGSPELNLSASLNRAIEGTDSAFIGRMDDDDLAHPQRLAAQLAVMAARPGLGVLGSSALLIDARGRVFGRRHMPIGEEAVRQALRFENPLIHPSVMIRRAALGALRYDTSFHTTQDYELWTRLAEVTRIDNLPDELLYYRVHPASVTRRQRPEQSRNNTRIRARFGDAAPDLNRLSHAEAVELALFAVRTAEGPLAKARGLAGFPPAAAGRAALRLAGGKFRAISLRASRRMLKA